ncbi:TetR/AcrR family transcriptional regulator [Leeia sp.]|uniref:TetR/AcrR family transcriptional regulator n=1 Tax=Leeia sp. TaxID=2884678 RepID=UPI0035B015E5
MIASLSARERILTAAHDLFYQQGIRATGVDRVIAAAGVTKVTLYRHFPSKQALVMAYLDYRHQLWMNWLDAALLRHGGPAVSPATCLTHTMQEWFTAPDFRGCAFINAVTELAHEWPEVTACCRAHKQDMIQQLAALHAGTSAALWAQRAALVVDGAIVRAQSGEPLPALLQDVHALLGSTS